MNLIVCIKLEKAMKKRVEYTKNGSDDGNVWFSVLDKMDNEIVELIKNKYNTKQGS